ncbi:MAG: transketolase family protein [Candidatus Micrarchaeota archaeon]|nr:transketolase family protein [Candidatus Micrarchaeota archaeon]
MKINSEMKLNEKLFTNVEKVPSRDGYGKGLVELGEKNKDVVVLCADLTESTRSNWFKERFPQRFVQMGVAEQNMMGVAAGLALSGKVPFVSSYAVFSPGRNWDQLRVSVCYTNANVKVGGMHAGISVGPDGATHQALEDIAITRVLPNLRVIVPCDWIQGKKATIAAGEAVGPHYLRFGREKVPVITTEQTPFEIGIADIYADGADVAIITCGLMVYESLIAAKELEKNGVSSMVVNCHTVKPIDIETITKAARKCGAVVTAEEHQINGGLGSAVSEVLVENYPVPMKRIGMKDVFGESGTPDELLKKYGMNSSEIVKACQEVVKRK